MGDFDLDSDLDLPVFNGHVYPQADTPGTDTTYAQSDFLYLNDGEARFTVGALSDAAPTVSRASAMADLDGDGWLDIVVIDMQNQVRVLRNRGAGKPIRGRGATLVRGPIGRTGAATVMRWGPAS